MLIICVSTLMAFGLDIFNLTGHCDPVDNVNNHHSDYNTQVAHSSSSTQNNQSNNSSVNNLNTQDNTSKQVTNSTNSNESSTLDKVLNTVKEVSSNLSKFGEKYIPYAAGGAVGSATMKHTTGGNLPQKIIAAAAATGVTVLIAGIAGAVVKGVNQCRQNFQEKFRLDMEKNRLAEQSKAESRSTTQGEDTNFTANSPMESGEMNNTLVDVLDQLMLFNVLEFLLILIIMYYILNVILKNKIGLFLSRHVPSKYTKIHYILSKLYNNGKMDYIFIFILLCMLLLVKFMGIFLINEIRINIDMLVSIYNYLKNRD